MSSNDGLSALVGALALPIEGTGVELVKVIIKGSRLAENFGRAIQRAALYWTFW